MEEIKIRIDVRGMNPRDRIKRVSSKLDEIRNGEYAEIVSDDERILKLAPQMIKTIGKADFIRSWKGDDGLYHVLIRKK